MKTIIPAVIVVSAICATAALADRAVSGAEAQRALAGKRFDMQCVDGTRGFGAFNGNSSVTVSYKRPATSETAMEQSERASVRAKGNEICVSWKDFAGGGNGCYPVAERRAGTYRVGSSDRWCDISAR